MDRRKKSRKGSRKQPQETEVNMPPWNTNHLNGIFSAVQNLQIVLHVFKQSTTLWFERCDWRNAHLFTEENIVSAEWVQFTRLDTMIWISSNSGGRNHGQHMFVDNFFDGERCGIVLTQQVPSRFVANKGGNLSFFSESFHALQKRQLYPQYLYPPPPILPPSAIANPWGLGSDMKGFLYGYVLRQLLGK